MDGSVLITIASGVRLNARKFFTTKNAVCGETERAWWKYFLEMFGAMPAPAKSENAKP